MLSESEWEYACRAGTTTKYSFGDDSLSLGKYAWFRDNSGYETHPVGEKLPNAFGLYDMHGNVCEWCADWLEDCFIDERPASLPVIRNGCWKFGADVCKSAHFYVLEPGHRSPISGIRVARGLN